MVMNSIQAVLMIFIMIAVGFFVSKTKWGGSEGRTFVSKLVMNVTLPCTIALSFITYFTRDMLASAAVPLAASFAAAFGTYFLSKLVCRLIKIPHGKKGVFTMLAAVSNAVFIGFPVAQSIFGESGFMYAVLFFLPQSTLINTVGFFELASDGETGKRPEGKIAAKRLFNPLFITILIGFLLVLLGITVDILPDFVSGTLSYMSGVTSPLSLVFVGMVLGSIKSGFKPQKGMLWILLIRFIAAPAIMLAFCQLFSIDWQNAQVFILLSSLPSMVQVTIMSEAFGGDTEYAAAGVLFTTLISLAAIPLYMTLFSLVLI